MTQKTFCTMASSSSSSSSSSSITATPAVITVDQHSGIKVDAAVIAEPFRREIRARVAKLQEQGFGM
jgi:hypothetical protein